MTHTDSVELDSDVGELDFVYGNQYSVTSGESFSYSGAQYASSTLTITVDAGHDNSTGPASSFDSWTGGRMIYTDSSRASEPNELNYAFCGDLHFEDFAAAMVPTCFGQGDDGVKNNWWLGGSDYSAPSTQHLCFTDPGQTNDGAQSLTACIYPGGDSYRFHVDDGGAESNWISLYSPATSVPLTVNPQQAGQSLLTLIEENRPDLTTAEKAALTHIVDGLPNETLTGSTPTAWSFTCDGFCADESDYAISSGQLWGGVHSSDQYDGGLWTGGLDQYALNNYSLNATAGREKTTAVADWFIDAVGDGDMIGAGTQNGTPSPSELNFAYCGELQPVDGTFAAASAPLCVGQGSNADDGHSNNWWVGGSEWTDLGSVSLQKIIDQISSPVIRDIVEVIAGDTEARVLVDLKRLTAVIALSGNVVTGAAVDGAVFVVGIG